MYCRNCGKELSDDAAFCPACGQSVSGEMPAAAATPAPNPAPNAAPVELTSSKSRLIAAILAYFLGVFGGHNFYVGRTGNAVAQLILTITVIGAVVSVIWVLVDFICILCGTYKDVDGYVLKTWLDN